MDCDRTAAHFQDFGLPYARGLGVFILYGLYGFSYEEGIRRQGGEAEQGPAGTTAWR